MKAAVFHLIVSLLERPSESRHSVDCDDQAGSVNTVEAMNEDRIVSRFVEQGQQFVNRFLRRHVEVIHWDADEAHACCLYGDPFPGCGSTSRPKADDGFNAQIGQLFNVALGRLTAPIQPIGHGAKISYLM